MVAIVPRIKKIDGSFPGGIFFDDSKKQKETQQFAEYLKDISWLPQDVTCGARIVIVLDVYTNFVSIF